MMELLQLLKKTIPLSVEYLELKISTLPSHISGLRTVAAVRIMLGQAQALSLIFHYDCLTLLVMFVRSPSVQALSQEIL